MLYLEGAASARQVEHVEGEDQGGAVSRRCAQRAPGGARRRGGSDPRSQLSPSGRSLRETIGSSFKEI